MTRYLLNISLIGYNIHTQILKRVNIALKSVSNSMVVVIPPNFEHLMYFRWQLSYFYM